ncbi:flagellar hook-basal body protein [Thermodesulfatator indicus DSM 15286]|uniref:Flagellar hook protein FlgE n=1 Tax=Thermodesulfatator indicus (strain DSM 15286 / JCM 11887 / CIR29812) TaxID=667014 RepID=F8ADC9_THEID|nr:flagellar hook-basal body complex protein [Thermodesulfatator indicus]AEH45944.1 flagellar hook-basal body protein [Thermodesulfatator indicus DSM 15286]
MGLTDALFASTSGLRSLGHGMSVVGDNVANLNTSAFKGARITFSDVMAQRINTSSGSGQMGRGASINALYPMMQQGSFESTASPTDLAIAGNGFFILKDPKSAGNTFYTRDGQFLVEKQGYLVNPAGLRVQGWQIDEVSGDITGALQDIQIQRSSPPVQTSKIDVITNLDAREELENIEIPLEGNVYVASGDPPETITTNFVVRDINGQDIPIKVELTWNGTTQKWDSYQIIYETTGEVLASGADTTATKATIELPLTKEKILINWSNVTHEDGLQEGLNVPGPAGLIKLDNDNNTPIPENTWKSIDVTVKDINGNDVSLRIYLYFQNGTPPNNTDFPAEIRDKLPELADGRWHYLVFQPPTTGATLPADENGTLLSWGANISDIKRNASFFLDGTTQKIDLNWDNVDTGGAGNLATIQSESGEDFFRLQQINTLYDQWDARKDTPLASTDYTYRTTLTIYDSLGTPHEVTIYYDRTSRDNVYEFLVACNPDEDQRDFTFDSVPMQWTTTEGSVTVKREIPSGNTLTQVKKGVLMYGRVEFDNQGNIKNFYDTYRVDPNTGDIVQIVNDSGNPVSDTIDGFDVIGSHGYPIVTADFLGLNLDQDPPQTDETLAAAYNDIQKIELNFGYYYKDGAWRSESVRTTQYATSNSTIFYDQDGYGPGYLESISVDTEGVLTGHYSNGRVIPLWMVGLANFNAPEMLDKAGGNLYRETTHSGPPVTGKPGTNGLGSIAPNSLEQSNVDLGEQFVKMITIQRGFQADARTITVTDAMLEELINLKR